MKANLNYTWNCRLSTLAAWSSRVLILAMATFALEAHSTQQTLAEFDWGKLADEGHLLGGTLVTTNGRSILKIVNTNDNPLSTRILNISQPGVTKTVYGLTGEVKCEGVKGDGYLEMWSCFAPAKAGEAELRYFSRTLGGRGEAMGKITGNMEWRTFWLPFDRTGTSNPPARLEVNVALPGQGTVYLRATRLVESTEGVARLVAPSHGWWDDQSAGLVGGIGGAVIGCFAGLLGWLASQGKARGFVLTSMKALLVLGVVVGVGAVMALSGKQPYAVWFPLALGAVLLLGIIPSRFRQFRKHYDELELRRMNSIDTLQS